jgi:Glycosyl hydrolases family 43
VSPATGKPLAGAPVKQLTTRHEAPHVYRRTNPANNVTYYYLFHSQGSSDPAPDTTYNIRVGRSSSPDGPFTDRAGVPLMQNPSGTLVLEGHGFLQAAGHNGVLFDSADGKDHLYYHYYDARYDDFRTFLGINDLNWTSDGWPYLMHDYGTKLPSTPRPYTLFSGDYLQSQNDSYRLIVQSDCNVVERRLDVDPVKVVWASDTSNLGTNCRLVMESDGELALYNGAGTRLWSAVTYLADDANRLVLQNDGNFVIYQQDNDVVCSRTSASRPCDP